MGSRKRSQGKARKERQGSQLVQVRSGQGCRHGIDTELPSYVVSFMSDFENEIKKAIQSPTKVNPLRAVMLGCDVTRRKYKDVWHQLDKRNAIKSCFVSQGVDQILLGSGHYDFAAALAVGTLRLEDEDSSSSWSILDSNKGRSKIRDLILSSSQEGIKFFSKRAPCTCLDDLMATVQSQAKTAQCIHCDKERERKDMFLCGKCLIHQYCSPECQRQAWPEHKPICIQLCTRFNQNQGA